MSASLPSPTVARRIPELDGLRGVAIGLVMAYHYFYLPSEGHTGPILSHFRNLLGIAWSGVDLFFVLSGFLIGGILLDARSAVNYFRVFYTRRFFRILPIYTAVLLLFPLVLAVSKSLTHYDFPWLTEAALPWYCYWTFAQNVWMSVLMNLGANGLKVTWSLAIEEQFYLTLPLLIRIFTGLPFKALIFAGILLAPVSRVSIGLWWHHNWIARFVLMPCRADALLLGVLVALLLRDPKWRDKIQSGGRTFAVLLPGFFAGVVALNFWAPNVGSPATQSVGYTWLGMFYALVLANAVTRPSSTFSRALRTGWLKWLGSIAYATYLLHQTVQGLVYGILWHSAPELSGVPTFLTALGALAISLVLAAISWRYFEAPLVRFGHKISYLTG